MKAIPKKIVTDERMRPVAVQIAYAHWLEIERRLGLETSPPQAEAEPDIDGGLPEPAAARPPSLQNLAEEIRPHWQGGVPSEAAFERLLESTQGIWTAGDGLEYQRRIRDEWTRPWDPEAQAGGPPSEEA